MYLSVAVADMVRWVPPQLPPTSRGPSSEVPVLRLSLIYW